MPALGCTIFLLTGCGSSARTVPPQEPPTQEQPTAPPGSPIISFAECAAAGFPVMESYPRQCNTDHGEHFVEDIGNELEKLDLIRINAPRPNQTIRSPLIVGGEARGTWFFEGDFPLELLDAEGNTIASGFAFAEGAFMTEEFVSFEGVLEFDAPPGGVGTLLLKKANPSGLPENYDTLEVPVLFE
jgi:hypothetical protein